MMVVNCENKLKSTNIIHVIKEPIRVDLFSFCSDKRDAGQCIGPIQGPQYIADGEPIAMIFCEDARFDKFRHQILCGDCAHRRVFVKIVLYRTVDAVYKVLIHWIGFLFGCLA